MTLKVVHIKKPKILKKKKKKDNLCLERHRGKKEKKKKQIESHKGTKQDNTATSTFCYA